MTNMPKPSKPRQFNVAEAKARFSELVKRAMAGEQVVIAKDNKAVLRLVPVHVPAGRRAPGSAKGQIWMAPDFEAPLDDFADYV
jgi:prevent-host-death family protein